MSNSNWKRELARWILASQLGVDKLADCLLVGIYSGYYLYACIFCTCMYACLIFNKPRHRQFSINSNTDVVKPYLTFSFWMPPLAFTSVNEWSVMCDENFRMHGIGVLLGAPSILVYNKSKSPTLWSPAVRVQRLMIIFRYECVW